MFPIRDDSTGRIRTPYVTYALIALNVLVFVFLQGIGTNEKFTYAFSTIPLEPTPVSVYFTLLTSMFMHGGLMICSVTCCFSGSSLTTSRTTSRTRGIWRFISRPASRLRWRT